MSELALDLVLGGVGLAGLAAGAAVWLRLAAPLVSSESRLERGLDNALILAWLAIGFFYLLAGAGLFRLWIAIAVILGSGLAGRMLQTRIARPDRRLADSSRTLAAPDVRDPWLWSAVPVLVIVAVRLIKSMAAPPMTWDAMTMHLPKAAFWIQSASLELPNFPDAWVYYRWFPAAGEVLFAWIMLPFRSDLLLGPFGVLVWFSILIAAARLARHLGAPPRIAWLAGAALAALPTVILFMTANYVDNLVVLFVIVAVTHAVMFSRTSSGSNATLSLAAAGLAIGTKTSALVVVAPVVATVGVMAWNRRRESSRPAPLLPAMMAVALVIPCIGYLHTWMHTGSPFYPFKAPLLNLPYHQGLADLFAGRTLLPAGTSANLGEIVMQLFWSPPAGQGHMNFGLGGVLIAVTAVAGLSVAVSRPGLRIALWLTLAGAAVSTPLIFADGNLALLTIWIGVLGRHLLPAFAPVALWAGLAPRRGASITLAASLLIGTVHQLQIGWSQAMIRPALQITAAITVSAGAVIALRLFAKIALKPRLRWSLLTIVGVLFLIAWGTVRNRARYPIYRETTARAGAFDAHPSHPTFAMGSSLWPLLDTPESLTVALTVGKDRVGHNQFFYPLLGSRLQNRLIYIPVIDAATDSELEPAERYARASAESWLEDLDRASADLVVGLWPATAEREWLASRGEEFEITALTSLGLPWVARRPDSPQLFPPRGGSGGE